MRSRLCLIPLLALLYAGSPCEARGSADDPGAACRVLLEKSDLLLRNADERSWEAARLSIQEATEQCSEPVVPVELRARALLNSTRVVADSSQRLAILNRALSILHEESPNSRYIPRVLEGLSTLRFVLREFDDSLELAFDALAERERLSGRRSREYVRGLYWIALTYQVLAQERSPGENYAKAQAYAEEAVARSEQLFGPRDPSTLSAKVVLIEILRLTGQTEESQRLHEAISPYPEIVDDVL